MSTTRNVVVYSVSFDGLFGRNRTKKYVSIQCVPLPEGTVLTDEELIGNCETYIKDIKAKSGVVKMTRYDNCVESTYDDLPGTSLAINITAGETAWKYSI